MEEKHRFNWEYKDGYSTQNVLGNKPLMTEEETECIISYLKPEHTMFEWGAGGSTLYFPKFVKKYYSVEYQLHWYKLVRSRIRGLNDIRNKIDLRYVPLNSLENYEKPPNEKDYEDFVKSIGNITDKIDVMLNDGAHRTRAFCAMEALKYMDENTLLLWHDYTRRDENWWIEKYFNIIERIEPEHGNLGLAIMKKKVEL